MTISGYSITVHPHPLGSFYAVHDFTCAEEELLSKCQEIVGGSIVPLPSADSITMYVNEDGHNTNLPRNHMAEVFWQPFDKFNCLANGDWLAGNLVILGPSTPNGKTTSAPTNTLDLIKALCGGPG
jgi:hypothetical protein